jgi:hypothetical protein
MGYRQSSQTVIETEHMGTDGVLSQIVALVSDAQRSREHLLSDQVTCELFPVSVHLHESQLSVSTRARLHVP